FNEAELDRLVAQVADSNLEMREMAARVAAAQALELAAGQEFRPAVRFAVAPAETPDARSAFLQAGAEAGWPLGLFGRATAVRNAAGAESALTQSDAGLLRTKIIADTVRSYIEWRAAGAAAANFEAQTVAQEERAELMRARVRLRLSGPTDLAGEEG